ncbi:ATP-binding cassette domain-containing protein [Bosea lathyri]|uniref:Glutathione import ATP-binding protein GsiA n=1 Tax=Bosea lathyri TaxID=1036778 RepID=A0A1H6AR08_9HYPH|nr:ATP-binding cassette domain-containing protein [Bosea lathyri]SEG50640.1 oligopeptide/dipeptide ABC transporter, ATP-binding protein, C-terminal domain-containing protein [Bosea lathyri]
MKFDKDPSFSLPQPCSALDVTIQPQILEFIKDLQKEEGMAILFVARDMGVVAETADRTVVMYNGEVVEAGTTADIFRQPQHPYTKALLAAVPKLGSMNGRARPMRFPIVDRSTGTSDIPTEVPDTVKDQERPLLQVSNLTTRFPIHSAIRGRITGRVHAVENVSFSVQAGETLALVGESGCGKSTTGRSLLRLVEPEAGSVRLDGVDVLKLGADKLREQPRRIQMIFQDPFGSLNPATRSAQRSPNRWSSTASPHRQARDKVADLLERVGLQAAVNGHASSITRAAKRTLSPPYLLLRCAPILHLDQPSRGALVALQSV